jgi:uncharacterized glyoxalase superfamily protein PhnB
MPTGHCVPYVRVKNARASLDYYHRCLGFHEDWEHVFAPQPPLRVSISRGNLHLFLSEASEDGSFGCCVYCSVHDADRLHAEFERAGALQLSVVKEVPWGREFSVQDEDGNELRFASPRIDSSMAA